jgi:hypothetical protein
MEDVKSQKEKSGKTFYFGKSFCMGMIARQARQEGAKIAKL